MMMVTPLQILHLEDNPLDAELVNATLRRENIQYRITRVDNRADFLKALETNSFDIIFADYALPSFDGLTALKTVRERDPNIPFILISGTLGEEVAIESLKSGATDYVLKERLSRLGPAVRRALQEMTERRERQIAQDHLRASEERYRKFFEEDLTGDFIARPHGEIIACNAAFARIFGFSSVKEAIGSNLLALFPGRNSAERSLELLQELKKLEYYETELRRRDGRVLYVIANVIGTFNAKGELTEILGYIFDNTERKRLEEQILNTEKMEAVGRLAGGVAHDFNNFLTIISGFSDLLLGALAPNDPRRRYADEIKKAAASASSMARQLLTLSSRQILKPEVLDLAPVVREMKEMLQPLLGDKIRFEIEVSPDLGFIKANRGQIEEVILNLAINARDAMPQGGVLTCRLSNVTVKRQYSRHPEIPPGDYVLLEISDTGVGMTDEVRAHLFEPFFTTKPKGVGNGLGLTTCYGIIKQSGGFINVESAPGQGATFKIHLPRVEGTAALRAPAEEIRSLPRGTETILLVEDDASVRDAAAHILRARGYNVVEAETAQEALRIIQNQPNLELDLLLTDVVLPVVGGKELASEVLSLRPNLKVLFMSGYTDEAVVREGILEQGSPFIPKPFTAAALVRKVHETLAQISKKKGTDSQPH